MLWYELTRWWTYRRIQHPKMRNYVWIAPLVLTVVTTGAYFVLPVRPQLAGPGGLLANLIQVLAILPGFFIAALAAVATFDRPEMEDPMPEPTPTVRVLKSGEWIEVPLSRRTFLTYVFSYLAVMSLMTTVVSIAINLSAPSIENLLQIELLENIRGSISTGIDIIIVVVIFYFASSILVTTLHGIYFLAERIHQPH